MYNVHIKKSLQTYCIYNNYDIKDCLSERGLSIPEAKKCVKDRREWRRIVGGNVDDLG